MKKICRFMLAGLLALSLTGCVSKVTVHEQPVKETASSGASAKIDVSALPGASDGYIGEKPDASPSIASAVSPLYAMSDVFRFVPLDPSTSDQVVLLTFDDAPRNRDILGKLLDTLDKHDAKAVFFVNGYLTAQNGQLLKWIDERGQTIGNHSYDHIDLKAESEAVVERQIGDVQKLVKELIGKEPVFFRPPYGSGGETTREVAKRHGLLYMNWSNGSMDWDESARNKPEAVIDNVMAQLHPGANILMHELSWTADALDELLSRLADEGYRFIDPATIQITD